MKILDPKDAINRRQDEELIVVKTAIYRVSCLNRTVLPPLPTPHSQFCAIQPQLWQYGKKLKS
ncbi:hypothetical protein KBT16_23430 [Nostoc sp. CCCryo 231-06]|nr:hypothetical protein [Nostoc sp. CCCryo 231-06]